jgi:hypothetical protein
MTAAELRRRESRRSSQIVRTERPAPSRSAFEPAAEEPSSSPGLRPASASVRGTSLARKATGSNSTARETMGLGRIAAAELRLPESRSVARNSTKQEPTEAGSAVPPMELGREFGTELGRKLGAELASEPTVEPDSAAPDSADWEVPEWARIRSAMSPKGRVQDSRSATIRSPEPATFERR